MEENSILITAEFNLNTEKVKTEYRLEAVYGIDLIVDKDITCNQLIDAIERGVEKKVGHDIENNPYFHTSINTVNKKKLPLVNRSKKKFSLVRRDTKETITDAVYEFKIPRKQIEDEKRASEVEDELEKLLDAEEYLAERYEDEILVELGRDLEMDEQRHEHSQHDINESLSEFEIFEQCQAVFAICKKGYISEDGVYVNPDNSSREARIARGGIDLKKITKNKTYSISHEDQVLLIQTQDGELTLDELGFVTSTRLVFDHAGDHRSAGLYDENEVKEAFREKLPLYNISNNPLYKLDNDPITVISPTDPPAQNRQSILLTLLTPLIMMSTMIGVRMFTSSSLSSNTMIWMSVAMGIASITIAILNILNSKNQHIAATNKWKDQYTKYISRLISEIKEKQLWDADLLRFLYPSINSEREDKGKNVRIFGRKKAEPKGAITVPGLISRALKVNEDIYSRSIKHPDFLRARVGKSKSDSQLVPSVFDIVGEKREVVFSSARFKNIEDTTEAPFSILLPNEEKYNSDYDYLIDLPYRISEKYRYLSNAPVFVDIVDCTVLGVVSENKSIDFIDFLEYFIFDLCYYHSPDDLQCILFFDEEDNWKEQERLISKFRYLPHFKELLDNLSSFVFNKEHAILVMNQLLKKLNDRKENKDNKYPHIIVFLTEEYSFKKHPISQFLPNVLDDDSAKELGISFVFLKRKKEELPRYCGNIIHALNEEEWELIPHKQYVNRKTEDKIKEFNKTNKYKFEPEFYKPREKTDKRSSYDDFNRAYRVLSSLYYHRIAEGAEVPRYVALFDLFDQIKPDTDEKMKNDIEEFLQFNWYKSRSDSDFSKRLEVPIGMNSEGYVHLNLHENFDGPHMLVAGTTGSGKSETILTFLTGLCMMYPPTKVNLLLVDMKGGGFIKKIGKLPHVVGTVSDIEGDENGTGVTYMLSRFLKAMSSEIKRRKRLFNRLEVDNIDQYIEIQSSRENIEKHIINLKLDDAKEDDKIRIKSMTKMHDDKYCLTHLFMVIDEFTELMRFSADNNDVDFKAEINTIARVGRSLGFHLILVSQNIEGAISDEIRVNSKARLCLKVATRQASVEMIGNDLAASPQMQVTGRSYLMVENGTRVEYFQSAYTGASILVNPERRVRIVEASRSGEYAKFYDSNDYKMSKEAIDSEKLVEEGLEQEEINRILEDDLKANARKKVTQLEVVVDHISKFAKANHYQAPKHVFMPPLANHIYFDGNSDGEYDILKKKMEDR